MNDKNNKFYQILNKINLNFYYIGNNWGACPISLGQICLYNYKTKNNFFELNYFLNYMKVLKNSFISKSIIILKQNNFISKNFYLQIL